MEGSLEAAGVAVSARLAHPRVLLLIPSYAKQGLDSQVQENLHPTMDYYSLQRSLNADLADYRSVDESRSLLVRCARLAGRDAGLAALGFVNRKQYHVIFSNGENVSIPLAALLTTVRSRPGHALIGHHLSTPKKKTLLRVLRGKMDRVFVYAKTQMDYATQTLGFRPEQIELIAFHADHRFYSPEVAEGAAYICSAGLEWRDYPTLIEAVTGMDIEVRLAAASPWSKHRNETEDRVLPPNVSARRCSYHELRDLYAGSRLVVVPLYENDFQAGVTTILEAMAMGKAVIATRTTGQGDVITHGENGLYVPPSDAQALRAAIKSLLESPQEAERLGAAARKTIEEQMTLDHWTSRIVSGVDACRR